jgi:hypothetical protein
MYCLYCVVLCIVCVHMRTVLLPPGGYPIAVKYIIYHNYFLINLHYSCPCVDITTGYTADLWAAYTRALVIEDGWKYGCYTYYLFIFNYALQPFKDYCAIWVRCSNFRHQASPRVSPRESTQWRKVELWTRNVWEFCLNADFHVTLRDLLHAVKLRHGTGGFTSPPKDGVLTIFLP